MKKIAIPHTRLGGTSFIVQENYVNGVRYTAERCDDVALLLTCVGDKGEYLPTREEIKEIKHIVEGEGATLHVHLPTDGDLANKESTKAYCKKILMAIERVEPLDVHTYVQHIDIIELRSKNMLPDLAQQECILEMLSTLAKHIENPNMLALENLETFALHFLDFCLQNTNYSRCVDIGHIWKDGHKPADIISPWFERTRLVHLHGLQAKALIKRHDIHYNTLSPSKTSVEELYAQEKEKQIFDHKSLAYMPHAWLDAVLHPLWEKSFQGVINLEVFNEEDFKNSCMAVLESRKRFRGYTSNKG